MIINNIDTNQNINENAINKLATFTRKYFESYEENENKNENENENKNENENENENKNENENEYKSDMEPDIDDDDDTDSLDFSNYQGISNLFSSNISVKPIQKELKKGKVFDNLINNKINNSNITRLQDTDLSTYNKFKVNSKFY